MLGGSPNVRLQVSCGLSCLVSPREGWTHGPPVTVLGTKGAREPPGILLPALIRPSPPAVPWWPHPEHRPSPVYSLQRANLPLAGLGRPHLWGPGKRGWDLTAFSLDLQPILLFSAPPSEVCGALNSPLSGALRHKGDHFCWLPLVGAWFQLTPLC